MSRNKKIMKKTKLIRVEQIRYMNTKSPTKKGKYTIFVSLESKRGTMDTILKLASKVAVAAAVLAAVLAPAVKAPSAL